MKESHFPKSYCVLRGNELVGIYDWLADALEVRGEGCQVYERLTRQTGTCMEHRDQLLAALKWAMWALAGNPYREERQGDMAKELIAKVDAHLAELDAACEDQPC